MAPGQVPHLQMSSGAGFSLLDNVKASACTARTSLDSAYIKDGRSRGMHTYDLREMI